jgi:hypothetical protein
MFTRSTYRPRMLKVRSNIETKYIAVNSSFDADSLGKSAIWTALPQKLLDVSELTRLGWSAKTKLRDGIAEAYFDFLANVGKQSGSQKSRSAIA